MVGRQNRKFSSTFEIGATACLGLFGEWKPRSGIGMQIFDTLGLDYRAINGLSLFDRCKAHSDSTWKLIFGSARHKGEIDEFRFFLDKECYDIAIMITPSEVEEEIWYKGGFWTQGWHCDSAKYGDVLAGSWNVYVKSADQYSSLDPTVPGRMMSSIRRFFADKGLEFVENPMGATCIRPIENSAGKTIIARRWNGEERLSPDSQIPPYSRKSAIVGNHIWPILDQAYREPKVRGELLVLGAHHAWVTCELTGKEQTDALWKSNPKGVLERCYLK